MNLPPVVSPEEWKAAREELLVKEKEHTRAGDALAAERRRMPRQAVTKDYRFEGPDGPVGLLDMFEGRRQLIVYRFFFDPGVHGWPERGCPGCSFGADQVAHVAHRDFGVDEWHGHNVFIREGDEVFRTYFVDKRGDETLGSTWSYLDITPLGRQEKWEDSPEGYPQTQAYAWWNYHDRYDEGEEFTHAISDATAAQRGADSV